MIPLEPFQHQGQLFPSIRAVALARNGVQKFKTYVARLGLSGQWFQVRVFVANAPFRGYRRRVLTTHGLQSTSRRLGVNDGSAIRPPVSCAVLGYVAKQHSFRRMGNELASHQVVMRGGQGFPAVAYALATHAPNTGRTHDSRDTLLSTSDVFFSGEVGMGHGAP